jgi:hypothetical protein
MGVPEFNADATVYRPVVHYRTSALAPSKSLGIVPAQRCPVPPGLCAKASRCCRRGNEGWCCDILDRCFDCFDV